MSDLSILVVDDSPTMRRIIVNTLKRLGYSSMTEATDGKNALKQIKQQSFDLIITDWNMPAIDGLTLAATLKQSDDYKNIPILMATSRSAREDIVSAIKAGVNGYIVKPFSAKILKSKIEQILSGL
jgi:two-component system chemotaxis response regulator CheY